MTPSPEASKAAKELLEKYSVDDLEFSWRTLKPFLPDPYSPTDARFHPSVCRELLQDVVSGKDYSSFHSFSLYAMDHRTEQKFKERIDAGEEVLKRGEHVPVNNAITKIKDFRYDFSSFLDDHQDQIAMGCGLNLDDVRRDAGRATEAFSRRQRPTPSPQVNRNRVMDSGGLPRRVLQTIGAVFFHP